jgi:excinuclease UvrABC ATPase subunit
LLDVGLDYLSLSRAANTLSGGESQRIRLASQLGSGLCGVLYVLDEPTIGLHPRDNGRLLQALTKLRDLGNTLIIVEHDREIIAGSDQLCDFGPGAGRFGGELVAQGTPRKIATSKTSVTGPYLSGKASIPIPKNRRAARERIRCARSTSIFPSAPSRRSPAPAAAARAPSSTISCIRESRGASLATPGATIVRWKGWPRSTR